MSWELKLTHAREPPIILTHAGNDVVVILRQQISEVLRPYSDVVLLMMKWVLHQYPLPKTIHQHWTYRLPAGRENA